MGFCCGGCASSLHATMQHCLCPCRPIFYPSLSLCLRIASSRKCSLTRMMRFCQRAAWCACLLASARCWALFGQTKRPSRARPRYLRKSKPSARCCPTWSHCQALGALWSVLPRAITSAVWAKSRWPRCRRSCAIGAKRNWRANYAAWRKSSKPPRQMSLPPPARP